MASSNQQESLYECVGCDCQLSRLSKSLPCFHGVCESCFVNTLDEAKTICKCPKCEEEFANWEEFVISPILRKEILRKELSSSEWSCDWCSEDGVSSPAKYWCAECGMLLCNTCIRSHKRFQKMHICEDLDAMEKSDAIAMMMDRNNNCAFHGEKIELFCEGCGNCYCAKCYAAHPSESLIPDKCANVAPLKVREAALKREEQLPTVEREMSEFEARVKMSSESVCGFLSDLTSKCDRKVSEIWSDYELIVEKAKEDAFNLSERIERENEEEMQRWRRILQENQQILREIQTWRMNFQHFFSSSSSSCEDRKDVDILDGMKFLVDSPRFPLFRHSLRRPETKCELSVTFPDYWRKSLESRDIGSVSFVRGKAEKLIQENRFDLPKSINNQSINHRRIISINVNKNDKHIFICDSNNRSLIEMNENGKILIEFEFSKVTNGNFSPRDMCFISSSNIFVVCGRNSSWDEKNLLFFERQKDFPFFHLKNSLKTQKNLISLCEKNGTIFVIDFNYEIHSFSKKGEKLETFEIEWGFDKRRLRVCSSRIRVDPSSGDFWLSNFYYRELICFDSKWNKICSMEKKEKICDFCFNEFGQIFFCDLNAIFSFPNKKLFEFQEKQKNYFNSIFVFDNKIFVSVEKNNKFEIEILKILY